MKKYFTVNKFQYFALIAVLLAFISTAEAKKYPVEGYWKSIDDKTGKATAIWKIEVKNKILYGYIVSYPDMKPGDKCTKCTGEGVQFVKNAPILGTAWLKLTEEDDGEWEEGYIIDSGAGKKYDAKVWEEEGKLMVRGYIGWVFSTQEWLKSSQEEADAGF